MKYKYENEVHILLKEMYFEDWMDDSDWNQFENDLFNVVSLEDLSNNFDMGIENGFSIDEQIEICKKIFRGNEKTI